MNAKHPRILVLNEPYALRISPALAKEIGFNESILLLQIEFLISTSSTEEIDGEIWTYQSLKKLKDYYFPWWSEATISRIAKKLEAKKYIRIGNYNKTGYDRTQWYSLNSEGIDRLVSIKIDTPILQNAKSKRAKRKMDSTQMQNRSAQDERPIPETPAETPTETKDSDEKERHPAVATPMAELLLGKWKELFPDKPQPRVSTKSVSEKIKARWKDENFRDNWQKAMEEAARSPTCQNESWFGFQFFIVNDTNYQKCLDRWMDWKDETKYGGKRLPLPTNQEKANGSAPTVFTVNTIDRVEYWRVGEDAPFKVEERA